MLIYLTVENFKSIKEPTTLSFAAGTATRLSGNLLQTTNRERYVKTMALYGPNASGKTTILDALYAIGSFVLFSNNDQRPTARIPLFEPFLLDQTTAKLPSRISVTMLLEEDRYTLEVVASQQQVWSETLSVQYGSKQPSRKMSIKLLIKRKWEPKRNEYLTELHDEMGPKLTLSAAKDQTTPNRLVLGKLAALNSSIARRIIEWFDNELEFYDMHRNPISQEKLLFQTARLLKDNEPFAALINRFLKDADTGIQSVHVEDETVIEPHFSDDELELEMKPMTKPVLKFRHASQDGSDVLFGRQKESSGTLRFVALLVAILQPSVRRRLVCVDEFSASMHPDLVKRLLQIVHSEKYNKLGNQLLFTTHDTHLIDPRELLRRDQVTICDKDRFGRTTTKRLDEFQDTARSDANLQKQYLEGRFGGLPQFGPSLEDVPTQDDPMEVGV